MIQNINLGGLSSAEHNMPRVLVVDNDVRTRRSYQELLKHWGYIPILAEGDGKNLLENARTKARANRCQFALVDMRLIDDFDEDDKSGLELIAKLQPATCIVISGRGNLADARESLERGAAGFVGKGEGPKALKEMLESEALKLCASKKRVLIEPTEILPHLNSILFGTLPDEYHDQLLDGFLRMFPDARSLRLEKVSTSHISTDFSTAPRPRSVILRVFEDDKQPVIVKFARVHKAKIEVERFHKFIDGRLHENRVPVLKGESFLWDIGGVKLSYVGTLEGTFANYFKAESISKIKLSLSNFFKITWKPHYLQTVEMHNQSLFELYCRVWDQEWVERIKGFQDFRLAGQMGQIAAKAQIINPIEWMKEYILGSQDLSVIPSTKTAVTHGDLHGDNMLMDTNQNIWVVDFERTGEGHILQDFIELEADLINRIPCTYENFRPFFQLCLAVSKPKEIKKIDWNSSTIFNPDTEKRFLAISSLRTLAHECTGITDSRQYIWGLLFNMIFRATITTGKERKQSQQRTLMFASILCHRLEHWDEPWPPEEWKSLF